MAFGIISLHFLPLQMPDPEKSSERPLLCTGASSQPSSFVTSQENLATSSCKKPRLSLLFKSASAKNDSATTVVQAEDHGVIASAVVLWDWDGVIPGRRTKGLPAKKGMQIDICRVINADWYQVHYRGSCYYLPSAFTEVLGVHEKSHQSLFPRVPLRPEIARASAQTGRRPSLTSSLPCLSLCASTHRENVTPPIPKVPSAPFDNEPFETDDGSKISIFTVCRPTEAKGLVVGLRVVLTPAKGRRFTSLTLNTLLPDGYLINHLAPENHVGQSSVVHEHLSQVSENRNRSQSLGLLGHPVTVTEKYTTTQDIRYSRVTQSTIRGAGINTNRASWVAVEDIGGKSGLDSETLYELGLATSHYPPTFKYICTVETACNDSDLPISEKSAVSWSSSWVEESLP